MNQDNELPLGWVSCLLGDILKLKNGYAFKSSEYQNEGIPIVRISDINDGIVDINKSKCILQNNDFENYTVDKGDILIAMSGATTGKFGIYNGDKKAYQNQRVGNLKLISDTQVNKKIIYYLLHSLKRKIEEDAYGGAQPNISGSKIEQLEIILPPLNEQHRIVTEIEKQFSRLDESVSALKRVQANLKCYKASVLKSAVEGKLTAAWREQHPCIEPAEQLLERLLKQRRAQWESAEINKMQASGKPPKDDKWKLKYKEPVKPDITDLPELPVGWVWLKYGDLCSVIKNGISEKPIGEYGTPIFRISAVRPLFFDMQNIRYIDNSSGRFNSYYLEKGDLVFTRYNGSRNYVGVCAEYRSDEKRLFPDKLIQTRIFSEKVLFPSYLEKVLNCGFTRKFLESRIRTTAGQSGVSGDDIKSSPVPICSIAEQTQIVAEVEKRLSVAQEVEQQINRNLKRAEHLRQAILKRAFSGKLVSQESQDPTDEPVSVLLEKIQT